ncbi:MAG: hypothetical protein GY778_20730 [bacterium]|nr:hypothetical protein [bacterium]
MPWLLLLGPAAVLRLIGISSTGVWHDEAMSIHTARMGFFEQLVDMAVANNQPPLYFLLLKLWAVPTWWPVWLRLSSVVVSLAGVVYAVRWMRLWDRRAGWLAGVLAATSPLMVHYAQEIRAYALVYTCLLAGLYYGERLAREGSRTARVGLLICTAAMSYAHFTGLLAAMALWVYTWIRGTGLRRTLITASAWLAVMVPVFSLGLYHAVAKVQAGYWVPPLTVDRLFDLAASWTGHGWLTLWERAGASIGRSWLALVGQALLTAGIGGALLLAVAPAQRRRQPAAWTMLLAGLVYLGLIVAVSLLAVSVALERTTFAAFIPLLGVAALSAGPDAGRRVRNAGTVCCMVVACVWTFTAVAQVFGDVERRPYEQRIFEHVADRFESGDVILVFPAEMQASAGYFLHGRASAQQIHATELPRLTGQSDGLRLMAAPREAESTWFSRFQLAVEELRAAHPGHHGIWLFDIGVRDSSNPDRLRALQWIRQHYVADPYLSVGQTWPMTVRRYRPRAPGPGNGP